LRRAKRLAQENKIMARDRQVVSSSVDIDGVLRTFAEKQKNHSVLQINVSIFNAGRNELLHSFHWAASRFRGFTREIVMPNAVPLFRRPGTLRPGIIFQVECGKRGPGWKKKSEGNFPLSCPLYQAGPALLYEDSPSSHDEAIGSLNFLSREFEAYSENDLRIAGKIANQIAERLPAP